MLHSLLLATFAAAFHSSSLFSAVLPSANPSSKLNIDALRSLETKVGAFDTRIIGSRAVFSVPSGAPPPHQWAQILRGPLSVRIVALDDAVQLEKDCSVDDAAFALTDTIVDRVDWVKELQGWRAFGNEFAGNDATVHVRCTRQATAEWCPPGVSLALRRGIAKRLERELGLRAEGTREAAMLEVQVVLYGTNLGEEHSLSSASSSSSSPPSSPSSSASSTPFPPTLSCMKQLPSTVQAYKRTAAFSKSTAPSGLLTKHNTKAGTWGLIVVEVGVVRYTIFGGDDQVDEVIDLTPGNPDTAFFVEFYGESEAHTCAPRFLGSESALSTTESQAARLSDAVGRVLVEVVSLRQPAAVRLQSLPHPGMKRVEAWALARTLDLQPGEIALDPFCGKGSFLVEGAMFWPKARFVGLDSSPEQLELASANAAAAGVEVDLREGEATGLPFEDSSIDAVMTAFAEVARVLRKDKGRAALLVDDLTIDEVVTALSAAKLEVTGMRDVRVTHRMLCVLVTVKPSPPGPDAQQATIPPRGRLWWEKAEGRMMDRGAWARMREASLPPLEPVTGPVSNFGTSS